jgi:hypothetical protein
LFEFLPPPQVACVAEPVLVLFVEYDYSWKLICGNKDVEVYYNVIDIV